LVFLLNSFKSILWINRRNENDIVHLYNSITPFVKLALGDVNNNMLNFGYWTQATTSPLEAQIELCRLVGDFADLNSAKRVIDVGSGFSAPAVIWKFRYKNNNLLDIICVDINLKQLSAAVEKITLPIPATTRADLFYEMVNTNIQCKPTRVNNNSSISLVNATAMTLPFADNCVDRIVALESAQHFKPLSRFLRECKRVLRPEGLLVIAVPVIGRNSTHKTLVQFAKLRILYFTWASEHYHLENIKTVIRAEDFQIQEILHVGHHVYEPSADYYIHNRKLLKQRLQAKIFPYAKTLFIECVERIIYISALKMKDSSKKEIIDYVLIKAVAASKR